MSPGLLSLSVYHPERIMTNDYWRQHHPTMISDLESSMLNKTWSTKDANTATEKFDAAMALHLGDPFRGGKERRWLRDGEKVLSMELKAATAALDAAQIKAHDIDLCLVGSFPPDQLGVGNAAFLASEMGMRCPVLNIEAACSASLMGLQLACSLVSAKHARHVLLVNSCGYSHWAPSSAPISLANGDAASAMVIGETESLGLRGFYAMNTTSTNGALRIEEMVSDNAIYCQRMILEKDAGIKIREATESSFLRCVSGALESAGLKMHDIDFFAFNAAAAWLVPLYTSLLGIDESRTINMHHRFANTGPVLTPTSLFYGLHIGKIPSNGHALMFAIGNTSNACAAVMQLNNVKLSPLQVPN